MDVQSNTVEPETPSELPTTQSSTEQPTAMAPATHNVPQIHFDAPPAYTPFRSTTSLLDRHVYYTTFIDLEAKALRVLAIGSIVLGSVSIFVGILAVVFGTLMYCSGTGVWGGLFCIINGFLCLFRLLRRNSHNIMKCLCTFSSLTIVACIVSITLSVMGTATNVEMCCSRTISIAPGVYACNYTASQLANSLSTCIGFVQTVFTFLTTALYAKYSSLCCHDEYSDDSLSGHQTENNNFRIL